MRLNVQFGTPFHLNYSNISTPSGSRIWTPKSRSNFWPMWLKTWLARCEHHNYCLKFSCAANLMGAVWTQLPSKNLNVERQRCGLRGNSARGRHFGFAKVALCTLTNLVRQFRVKEVKILKRPLKFFNRSKIRPVSLERSPRVDCQKNMGSTRPTVRETSVR